jgi:cytolysin-activating lysine-acyltransferase
LNKRKYYALLGQISSVMMSSDIYQKYPIACLTTWIRPPVLLGQCHLYYDLSGGLIGYITWALLAEDAEDRWLHDPNVILHISEWNEGDRLWIMDFVALNGDIRRLILASESLFPGHRIAKSLRRNVDGSMRKVTTWSRRTKERLGAS